MYAWAKLWHWRMVLIFVLVPLISFGSVAACIMKPFWGWLILLIGVFRIFNLLRIAQRRMHEKYLFRATSRSGYTLLLSQALVLVCWYFGWLSGITWQKQFGIVVLGQLGVAVVMLFVAVTNIRRSRYLVNNRFYSDQELPTVSVVIAARDEDEYLERCLRAVLASDYPKLEIIALDDCSRDKTPEIIRKFAHDGVRFIRGAEPQQHWLAKNLAYDRLADEATGEILVFCSVDIVLGPTTIRSLITSMLSRHVNMISVMPKRYTGSLLSSVIQPMRYWWELVLPRHYTNRPAVLNSCWLIKRDALKRFGAFDAVTRSILPEAYFARRAQQSNKYGFWRADSAVLDVRTVKPASEQLKAVIRTRYPEVHKRPEMILLLLLAEGIFLLGPFLAFFGALLLGSIPLLILTGLVCLLIITTHVLVVYISNPAGVPIALINFPVVAITELLLTTLSMYRYEFSSIEWKGRNICLPVMHITPRLPQIDKLK